MNFSEALERLKEGWPWKSIKYILKSKKEYEEEIAYLRRAFDDATLDRRVLSTDSSIKFEKIQKLEKEIKLLQQEKLELNKEYTINVIIKKAEDL